MATLVASRVFSIAPWLNTGEMAPVVTPRPTCIGFALDPPTVWLTRSWHVTELDLKPDVLLFAGLFPITLRYEPFALRPERPAEKEPTAMFLLPCAAASLPPRRLQRNAQCPTANSQSPGSWMFEGGGYLRFTRLRRLARL